MTLTTTASRVSYPGTGSTGPFAFPFKVFAATDLLVTQRSAAGTETTLAYVSGYSVSGVGNASGTITLVTALPVGQTLVIRRSPALTQPTSLRNQGPYFAADVEDAFDRLGMEIQSVDDQVKRAFRVGESYSPGDFDLVLSDLTAGKVVTTTGTGLTTSTLDTSGAVALPGAGRTVATLSQYLAQNAVFAVLDFAPLGVTINDGVNSADSAIVAAREAAAASTNGGAQSRGEVKFGPGVYLVTNPAILTPTTHSSLPGIKFSGAGMYASIIRFGALAGATWLYDNGATARTQFNKFEDLGFEGMDPAAFAVPTDIPANAKGFKITSAAHEQGFRFFNCRFSYFDTLFDMEGTNTASEMKFYGCKVDHIRTTFYLLNNANSFNHEFHGTDVETIYGDVFSVSASGGGAIKVYGGSWVMSDRGDAVNTYFFKTTNGSGFGAYPFHFSGIRFELRGNYNNLCSLSTTHAFDLVFDNCLIEDQGTVTKANWCTVAAYSAIYFRNCTFYELNATPCRFLANSASRYKQAGTITFDACNLPIDWSDRCTVNTFYGHIRAINCRGQDVGAPAAHEHFAHDFDLHWDAATPGQYDVWSGAGAVAGLWDGGSPTDCSLRLKTAQLKLTSEYWPSVDESTLKLPRNAIIKGIHLRKPANGADVTNLNFSVGRNDKSGTAHLVSNTDQNKNKHTGDVDNYFYHVGSTTNERTLRLYASAVTGSNINGGIVIVEYY